MAGDNEDKIFGTKFYLEQLLGEYRILQDKIDKIAGFRFTVRGWSVTLVIASAVAAASTKLSSPAVLYGIIPFIVAFCLMERAQGRLRHVFERRLYDIEKRVSRLLDLPPNDSIGRLTGYVPRIARELIEDASSRSSFSRWLHLYGYFFFYFLQVAVLVCVVWWIGHRETASPSTDGSVTVINNNNIQDNSLKVPAPSIASSKNEKKKK